MSNIKPYGYGKEDLCQVLEYADVKESLMCEREYGLELGLEQGRELGLEQGRELGLEQGREERTHQLALNMLAEGLDSTIVAKITGLTEKEIRTIACEA